MAQNPEKVMTVKIHRSDYEAARLMAFQGRETIMDTIGKGIQSLAKLSKHRRRRQVAATK